MPLTVNECLEPKKKKKKKSKRKSKRSTESHATSTLQLADEENLEEAKTPSDEEAISNQSCFHDLYLR